ncbi:MAG: hypothetical protein JJ979_03295 [Roseibium sp.]|nr:hypothetical protein [Roseibium sp.]
MITNKFSELAERAGERYGLVLETWRSIFNRAVANARFGSPAVKNQALIEAYNVAHKHVDDETERMRADLEQIALEARSAALAVFSADDTSELTDELTQHLNDCVEHLRSEYAIQIERDIASLRKNLTITALQISVSARAQGVSRRNATLQYQVGNSREMRFYFHDRANRKWPSRKYIRTIWRHELLDLYNDVVLATAAEYGAAELEVSHAHAKAGVHGKRLSLSYNSELPNYSEVKAEIFHPNSESILVPIVRP